MTKDTTVSEIINDPAFGDFGRLLFPVDRAVTGGGFVYVGAMHDSFPYALEVSKKGYHVFALIYRPDSAYEDLARAIAYVNDHAMFLENYDFSGKHIYPVSQLAFMDTTQYAQFVEFIKTCTPGAVVDDGIFSKDNAVISSYITDAVM